MGTTNQSNVGGAPQDSSNNIYWSDMNYVLQQREADLLADEMADEVASQQEEQRLNTMMQNELDNQSQGSGMLGILNNTSTSTPINLVGGGSAPPTTNSAKKMKNTINGV